MSDNIAGGMALPEQVAANCFGPDAARKKYLRKSGKKK
jgi:hypothetical protein